MHVVQQKVDAVRRQARRLTCLYGTAWTLAVILLAVLVACSLDYALRIQEHGIRWMITAGVVGLATWSVVRFLLPALRYRPSDVEIATRIERQDPRFQESLSSAVEFLGQPLDDARAGSAELRRAVILEAEQRLEAADPRSCLDHRRARNAALAASAVALLVLAVVALDVTLFWKGQRQFQRTPASLLAVYRLAMPWSNADWPRWNALQFVKGPRVLARGGDFEAEVVDARGRLPERVELQFLFDGDRGDQLQTKLMKPTADGSVVHRLENITRPFKYRAVGGDHDNMPWIALRLVEPPRLAAQEIRLHPPDYSGFPARESGPRIEALQGTRIEFRGQADKKLREVRLHAPGVEQPGEIRVQLSEDRRQFTIAPSGGWQVRESGRYRVELIDEEGLSGGDEGSGEIVAREDQPPTVSLERPAANSYLTTQARPVLRVVAKDDLAVGSIELRYLRSGASDQGEQVLVLRSASEQPPVPVEGELGQGDKVALDTTWDLAQIDGLAPGDWIDFHVAASDYRPQWGQSNSRRLTIISQDQLEDRLAQRQATILARLAEVLELQRSARSQTQALEIQLDETGALEKPDIDQLQSAELNQRQIGRQLSEGEEGIPGEIGRLLEELESNRVDHPDLARRMQELQAGLESLGRENVPVIQRHLISALKTSRDHLRRQEEEQAGEDRATPASVQQAGREQQQVIAALENMLGELTQWDNYRRFARDINRLQGEQQEIRRQTDQLRMETLTRQRRDLSPQERADLRRLAQQQADVARRLDKIQSRMQQMRAQLGSSDPLAAETLDDALATSRRLAISGLMRESSRNIEENRVGEASQQQEQIEKAVDELLDVLANRREHELDRLLSQLRRAADDLDGMRQAQAAVQQQLQDAAQGDDPAAARRQLDQAAAKEQELAEAARQLARRLERLQAPRAGDSVTRAAQRQQQSSEAAGQGQGREAQQQADDARQQLEQARQQLEQRIEQAEQDLFEEQMARLEQVLAGLIDRQRGLLETTLDLHRLQQQQEGKLQRGQLATLGDLSAQQRNLATETGIQAEKVARARAFQLGLEGATREMARAARGLDRRDPGPSTQQAERGALSRLEQLAEALRQEPAEPEPQEPPPGQNPQNAPMSPEEAVRMLAELKLVRLMQEQINQRTEQLETLRIEKGEWTAEQRQEASDLAREQGQLADLVLELLERASAQADRQAGAPETEPAGGDPEPPGDLDDLDRALDKELLDDL